MINTVIDLSHHNVISDFDKVKNAGISGIIHKATQGYSFIDSKYKNRCIKWKEEMNMLWGAYHFASTGSGITQAKHFLKTVDPDDQTLLVLDYEADSKGIMSIHEAEQFVQYCFDETGRWIGIYSGNDIKEEVGNISDTSVLRNCWLWIAQYGPRVKNIPHAWDRWTMWQYTDGVSGPDKFGKNVPGIGKCDRDLFNGDISRLLKLWNVPEEKNPLPQISLLDYTEDVA